MLIGLLQKGLQYQAVEYHLNEDGTEKECVRPWSLLDPHVCLEAKPSGGASSSKDGKAKASSSRIISIEEGMAAEDAALLAKKESKKRKKESSSNGNKKVSNDAGSTAEPKEKMAKAMVERFLESEVVVLTGHQSEVISCAWNPVAESGLLASVAGDDTARIWPIPADAKLDPEAIVGRELVLGQGHGEGESKDITTLDWSPDGRALAVGCYDGKAMLWSAAGEPVAQLDGFKGPVFALRWSPSGRFIAGAGLEHCAVVWEAASPGKPLRLFRNHASPTMDLDWRDDACFATCTTEKTIYVYHLGDDAPDGESQEAAVRRVFRGHEDEINSVRWSPDGSLLASCSDDTTARIWDASGASDEAKWVLAGHAKEIYCLEWSPTGPGTANPALPPLLATASFDATVRLWDPLTGRCLHVLARHTEPVYAIGFSPDGRFLASGSLDETLNIWAVADGRLVRTYDSGRGGIFEIAWSPTGSRLSACTSDSTVCVFDFRP
jgi:transducin (beta)-like 1